MDKLARKSVDFYKRDFIALNIGIAYFKVPEFKERFMKAIMQEKLRPIPEWKNFHWSLENEEEKADKTIDHFFNWSEYFYDQIPESEQRKKNLAILAVIASMKKWEEKLSKRGVALFLVVAKWAEYVRTTVVKKNIAWNHIPGYGSILRVIFCEMKERELAHYPDSLIEAAVQLSANESIIPVFVEILFNKTNIHIPKDVEIWMEITVKLLSTLNRKGSIFPSNFDFSFFYKGIDFLIDYQHSISTPKWLWLIYKTFHVFPLHEQCILVSKLLKENLMKLFFTWSWNIRDVFIKIFFYQLSRTYSSKGEEYLVEEEKEPEDKKKLPKIKGIDFDKQMTEEMDSKSFLARNSFIEEPSLAKVSFNQNKLTNEDMFEADPFNNGSGTIHKGTTIKSIATKTKDYDKNKNKIIKLVKMFEDDIDVLNKAIKGGKDFINFDVHDDSDIESKSSEEDSDESLEERSGKEILSMVIKKIPFNQRHYINSALNEFNECKRQYISKKFW